MNINIRGKNIEIGMALQEHIQLQASQVLSKYYENIPQVQVNIGRDAHLFTSHIQVHVGKDFFADANGKGNTAYEAFNMALEHAAKQVRRHKRINHDKHHRKEAQKRK